MTIKRAVVAIVVATLALPLVGLQNITTDQILDATYWLGEAKMALAGLGAGGGAVLTILAGEFQVPLPRGNTPPPPPPAA